MCSRFRNSPAAIRRTVVAGLVFSSGTRNFARRRIAVEHRSRGNSRRAKSAPRAPHDAKLLAFVDAAFDTAATSHVQARVM
jgi:hypothetical protein